MLQKVFLGHLSTSYEFCGINFQFPKPGDASPAVLPARGKLDGRPELGVHMEQRSQVPFDNKFGSYMSVSVVGSIALEIYSVYLFLF